MRPKKRKYATEILTCNKQPAALGLSLRGSHRKPRFILEGSEDDFENDRQIYWIDKPELPQIEIDTLIAEAEYFIDDELDCEDSMSDDDEEE